MNFFLARNELRNFFCPPSVSYCTAVSEPDFDRFLSRPFLTRHHPDRDKTATGRLWGNDVTAIWRRTVSRVGRLIFFRIFLNFHIFDIQGGGGGSPDPILGNYLFPSFSRNDSGIRPKKKHRKQTGKNGNIFRKKCGIFFMF